MEGQNSTAQQTQPVPTVLQLYVSPEEASLILNKLNVCEFKGFGEATLAVTLLGKIQSANRIPVSTMGPTTQQMNAVKTQASSTTQEVKEALSGKRKFATVPKMSDIVKEEKPNVPTPPPANPPVEEDKRPVAPLAAINEARKQPDEDDSFLEDDTPPPPEDAGIFSVINKSTVSGSEKEYV